MSQFYLNCMKFLDKFVPQQLQPLWQHPAGELKNKSFTYSCIAFLGPKTIFFWAPFFKWVSNHGTILITKYIIMPISFKLKQKTSILPNLLLYTLFFKYEIII